MSKHKEHKEHKSKMRSLFKGFRKSTTDLSEWSKNDDKLMKAVESNDTAKLEALLSKKTVNPTKLGSKGFSVFHEACTQGKLPIVNILIAHGAEVNVLSIQGNTSVQLAAREGHPKVLERLIEAGGVIDHKDGLTLTALHHACARGQTECVQVLLRHQADPNIRDKSGKPPLFYAAYAGDSSICKELLDRGANVNAHDDQQLTALMAAAKKGHCETCEFLLKKGADPTFTDVQGHDALSFGLSEGFEQLKEVFARAPTRASWDVHQTETSPKQTTLKQTAEGEMTPGAAAANGPQIIVSHPDETDQTVQQEQGDIVAKFVPDANTPEVAKRQVSNETGRESAEVIQILADKRTKEASVSEDEDSTIAERAASPPQSVIDQRTLEAFKARRQRELEEENDHMNDELRQLSSKNKRLQEAYDSLKEQLANPAPTSQVQEEEVRELEEELQALKQVFTEEQEKNAKLVKKMEKYRKKQHVEGEESAEDSWNDDSDDDDEIFAPAHKPAIIDHKPQTLLLLQNQVAQLRQENKQLRERMHDKTGSVSSLNQLDDSFETVDKLKQRLEEVEMEKNTLIKQFQVQDNNNVFPEDHRENVLVLEQENTQLHTQLKQLRNEISALRQANPHALVNGLASEEAENLKNKEDEGDGSAIDTKSGVDLDTTPKNMEDLEDDFVKKDNEALKTENALLTEELVSLRDTYNKLVIAGDNLQDIYDQLVLEKEEVHADLEKALAEKQDLVKENEYLLSDGNAMHDDIEKLVLEVEKLHDQNQIIVKEKDELEKQLAAVHVAGKASDIAALVEERDKLKVQVEEYEIEMDKIRHDHAIVLEEIQSLQGVYGRMEYEKDQIQQEFDSLQDEFEAVQQQLDGLQQDYGQLEQDYSELLADKEKIEQEFLEVQTASVQVEQQNPAVAEERDKLQQENGVLVMEKEQLDMTINELSKSNALLNEELTKLKEALKLKQNQTSDDKDGEVKLSQSLKEKSETSTSATDLVVEKDRRIRSLQIQISRLQQQLAESDRHYRDVINTYRTHLLSAVQGHMDPDVRQALYNIIELRSTEQFC